MANYRQVNPLYWTETAAAWPERARLLGMWLMTCEHSAIEGLYRLHYGYIAADLGWTPRQVEEHMQTLIDAGFAEVDLERHLVLVPEMLREQQPKSAQQIKGAVSKLARLPRSPLLARLHELALSTVPETGEQLAPRLAAAMADAFGLGADTPPPSVPDTHTDTHTDTHADGSPHPSRNTRAPARRPSSSSNSTSNSRPPQPPTGGRQRDLARFSEQMAEWHAAHQPRDDERERWAAAVAALSEQHGTQIKHILSQEHAHLHPSPNGRLVIGVSNPDRLRETLRLTVNRGNPGAFTSIVGNHELVACDHHGGGA